MAKGYWVARVDVHDAEAYKNYASANGAAFAKFGGRFLVRGGAFEAVAGTPRQRIVVIEPIRLRWNAGARPNIRPPERCRRAAPRWI